MRSDDRRIATMKLDPRIAELLRPEKLKLPRSPRVLRIDVEPYVDSLKDDALQVWVMLDEKTSESQRRMKHVEPILRAIEDALDREGIELFPYVRIVKPSERRRVA
jgi:hypothetical protein